MWINRMISKRAQTISKILFILGSKKFLACLEHVKSYAWSFSHSNGALICQQKSAKITSVIDVKNTLENWIFTLNSAYFCLKFEWVYYCTTQKTILFYDFRCHNLNPKDTLQKNWALTLKKLPQAMYMLLVLMCYLSQGC